MTNVFIIILNFNGRYNILQCLYSLKQLKENSFKKTIIVVDNASSDDSIKAISQDYPKVTLIANKENVGFSEGNNIGIRYALSHGSDFVLILNSDTIVDKDMIEELLTVSTSDKKIAVVAPKIYFAKGYEFHKNRYKKNDLGKVIWYAGGIIDWNNIIGHHLGVDEVDHGQYDKKEETEYASGCCMLVKKEVFKEIGLFDSKYFLYYEDSDFCKKVKDAGYKIMYQPKAILWHKNAGSAGGSGSTLQDYYITRNRLLFGMRYASLKTKLFLIKESLVLLLKGRFWQKNAIYDFYRRRFGKGTYSI